MTLLFKLYPKFMDLVNCDLQIVKNIPLPQVYSKSVGVSERHQRFAEGRRVERQRHQQQRNDDHVTGAPVGEGSWLNIWS